MKKFYLNPKILRVRIRSTLKSLGWPQKKLAAESGLQKSTVTRCLAEGQGFPRADIVSRMAMAMDVSIDWLMDRTVNPNVGGARIPGQELRGLVGSVSDEDYKTIVRLVKFFQKEYEREQRLEQEKIENEKPF